MVKGVEEVAPELQPHTLRDGEVLLQTEVQIRISWSDHRSLRRTSSEYIGRIGVWGWVEPSIAGERTAAWIKILLPAKSLACPSVTIRAQPTATRIGGVAIREIEVI